MKMNRLLSMSLLVALVATVGSPICRAQSAGVTMASYNRLKPGMTYLEVVKILGKEGTEVSSNEIAGIKAVMYQWNADGLSGALLGGNMNAIFQNGKLVQKAQFGLR